MVLCYFKNNHIFFHFFCTTQYQKLQNQTILFDNNDKKSLNF